MVLRRGLQGSRDHQEEDLEEAQSVEDKDGHVVIVRLVEVESKGDDQDPTSDEEEILAEGYLSQLLVLKEQLELLRRAGSLLELVFVLTDLFLERLDLSLNLLQALALIKLLLLSLIGSPAQRFGNLTAHCLCARHVATPLANV